MLLLQSAQDKQRMKEQKFKYQAESLIKWNRRRTRRKQKEPPSCDYYEDSYEDSQIKMNDFLKAIDVYNSGTKTEW